MINLRDLEEKKYYSNVSFRAAIIVGELYKNGNYSPDVLKDAQEIVSHCKAIFDDHPNLQDNDLSEYIHMLMGDTKRLVNNPNIKKILKGEKNYITRVQSILEKIIKEESVSQKEKEYERTFFIKVYDNARNYLAFQ
jgi:hypothetical protein